MKSRGQWEPSNAEIMNSRSPVSQMKCLYFFSSMLIDVFRFRRERVFLKRTKWTNFSIFFKNRFKFWNFCDSGKNIISQPFDLVPKHLANDTIRRTDASHSVSLMPNWKRSKRPYQLQVTTWLVSNCSKHHGYHRVVEANNLIQQLIGMKSKLRLSALSSCVRLNAFSSKGWEPSNRGCHIVFIKKMGIPSLFFFVFVFSI